MVNFSNIFVDTGLNLTGPTGAQGSPGANNFGTFYPGLLAGSVWIANGAGSLEETSNYYMLKGDTDFLGLNLWRF